MHSYLNKIICLLIDFSLLILMHSVVLNNSRITRESCVHNPNYHRNHITVVRYSGQEEFLMVFALVDNLLKLVSARCAYAS